MPVFKNQLLTFLKLLSLLSNLFFLKTGIILLEDGTLVPKHVGDMPLLPIYN
jgi:hypothetical protein